MKISFANLSLPTSGTVVALVSGTDKLTPAATALNKATGGALTRAMQVSSFKGKANQTLSILAPGSGGGIERVLLVGLGKAADINEKTLRDAGGTIYATLATSGSKALSVLVDMEAAGAANDGAGAAAQVAYGARLRSYRFDKYRTTEKPEDKPGLKAFRVLCASASAARRAWAPLDKIADGVIMTRNLVSEPPNTLYPETLAKQARTLGKLGVQVEVLGEAKMKSLGMGALLGVGQGSVRPSQLVVMRWNGAGKGSKDRPIAFVGKGVTFDTGGISLKPSANMDDMKYDMGGAGVVVGLMKALAGRKARVNAVGVIGAVENMPGGNAQRPGDIVTSMSGKTIEILNTDAEGRLVLADALHYTVDRFNPKFVIDLATLTGAIIVTLGGEHAGLFSNSDSLSERLLVAGTEVDEKLWRLPMGDAYDKMIDSPVADMKNIGGGGAGSIVAAQFLHRFTGKTPWAHLDIAGVAWSKKDTPLMPKGGSGFGVRLLDRLVSNHYEKS
jgi:leucyl aminopeptidase